MTIKERTIHEEFSRYGKNAREWMNKCVLMLPEIDKNRIWKKRGFGSIYEYAGKIAGMSRHKVDDSLRIIRKIEDKPALMKVAKMKGINSVRPVATIASKETDSFWAKKAEEMSKHTLATFVRGRKTESRPGTKILVELDKEIVDALEKIKGDGDLNDAIKKLLGREKPATVKTNSRAVPAKIKRYIKERSGGLCEHPNCKKAGEHIHHTEPFAIKKEHNPDKLLHLCKAHHTIIHMGYEQLPRYDIRNLINQRFVEFTSTKRSAGTYQSDRTHTF